MRFTAPVRPLLTRIVDLLGSFVAGDLDLVFCDLPHCTAGALGTLPSNPNFSLSST
jgi:hypothetical protein